MATCSSASRRSRPASCPSLEAGPFARPGRALAARGPRPRPQVPRPGSALRAPVPRRRRRWPTTTTSCCAARALEAGGGSGGPDDRRRPPGRLHLAVIPQNPVLPLDNGGKIRNFHLFRALAKRHRVSLLLTEPPPEPSCRARATPAWSRSRLPKPPAAPRDLPTQPGARRAGGLRRPDQPLGAPLAARATRTRSTLVLVGSIGPTAERAAGSRASPRGGHPQHRVGAAGQRHRPTDRAPAGGCGAG